MAEDIALCKADGEQWGFRMTGGADFGSPLTIIKVTKAGVAERSGLKVGDMLMMLNDSPLNQMNHGEATDFILQAGNSFNLTVIRGNFALPSQQVTFPHKLEETPEGTETVPQEQPGETGELQDPLEVPPEGLDTQKVGEELAGEPQQTQQGESDPAVTTSEPTSDVKTEHVPYTEEEFADMMSGCAEVIQERCLGVDFQKLVPEMEIKSEVLELIIAENVAKPKTLSTFNQRPKRPRVKPKGEPAVPPVPYNPLKYRSEKKKEEVAVTEQSVTPAEGVVVEEGEVVEAELPTTEDDVTQQEEGERLEGGEGYTVEDPSQEDIINDEIVDEPSTTTSEKPIVNEPPDIESQITEIQQQLQAIVQLPIEIQQHLSFIQEQLAKILQLKTTALIAAGEDKQENAEKVPAEESAKEVLEEGEQIRDGGEQDGLEGDEIDQEVEALQMDSEPEPLPVVEVTPSPERKKDIQWLTEEPEKRPTFYPLTPFPRPIRLPGGRTWSAPKDVYTEEFIAETISGNEEVILGTTIGGVKPKKMKFHLSWSISPSVDFHKFDRNYDHLKDSYVYKMIHEYENTKSKKLPGTFISKEQKALAAEDFKTSSRSSSPLTFAVGLKSSHSARSSPIPAGFL